MTDIKQELALAALEKYLETKSHLALEKFWQLYPKPIPSWHVPMMNDESRNLFYLKEIKVKCPDKVVLDIGCGSGLLTQYALESGAKHVYALERDPVLQTCFQFAFKSEIEAGRVTLLSKNSVDLVEADFKSGVPEVIIHEIFGSALFNEKVIETFSDLFKKQILNTSMEFVPQKFTLNGCLHKQKFESQIKDPKYSDQFWFLEDISYFGVPTAKSTKEQSDEEDLSPSFEIFKIDIKNLTEELKANFKITAKEEGNQLRVWFNLLGDESTLSTDIKENKDNHWGNSKFYMKFSKGETNITATYANQRFLAYVK
jgi:predicted RNA methylase